MEISIHPKTWLTGLVNTLHGAVPALTTALPEALVVSIIMAIFVAVLFAMLTRNMQRIPGRGQALVELIVTSLENFVVSLIGPEHGKKYVPLIGTIFIYIFFLNVAGLVPGWMSPTSNINVTAGLAIPMFLYVQWEGIRANGLWGYIKHFMGVGPTDPAWMWLMAPMNFAIHLIGELARPLSLTIRLFGNLFGEDVVIAILLALGVYFTKFVPFQLPMYFLAVFTGFVQAMVFSILCCVYIASFVVHDDHGQGHGEHHDEHGHGHDHGVMERVSPAAPA